MQIKINSIYNDDCCSVMKQMINDGVFVDLTVTSPPYDTLRKYDDTLSFNFDKFKEVAKLLYDVTKDGGVLVWIVADKTDKGSETGTSFKQALYLKEVGFNLHDTMIWRKTNPMPRVKTSRYFDCFEYMFVFSKGKPKTFNPILVDCKFGGKVYNSTCKNIDGESGRTKKTFVLNDKRYKDNIWDLAIEQNKTEHPAVFPSRLAEDHILSWSNEGDLVFDPFVGSGTTALMAQKNGRNYIGVDIYDKYCKIAEERLWENKDK